MINTAAEGPTRSHPLEDIEEEEEFLHRSAQPWWAGSGSNTSSQYSTPNSTPPVATVAGAENVAQPQPQAVQAAIENAPNAEGIGGAVEPAGEQQPVGAQPAQGEIQAADDQPDIDVQPTPQQRSWGDSPWLSAMMNNITSVEELPDVPHPLTLLALKAVVDTTKNVSTAVQYRNLTFGAVPTSKEFSAV